MSTPAPGTPAKSGIHPGIVVGAIAVVVFGAAGAASYLGLLPGSAPQAPATPVSVAKPAQQAGVVGVLHLLWAYVFPGIVPAYVKPVAAAAAAVAAGAKASINPDGLMWLGIFVGIITCVTLLARRLGADLEAPVEGHDEVHFH